MEHAINTNAAAITNQQATSPVTTSAATVAAQQHQAVQAAAANIQIAQQAAPHHSVTNNQAANPPLALSPIAFAITLRDESCKGYDALHRKQVCALFAAYYQFQKGTQAEKQVWRTEGANEMQQAGMIVRIDTSDCRMLTRLCMPWLDGSNALKIEKFFADAFAKGDTPDTIEARYNLCSPQKLASQGKDINDDKDDKPNRKDLISRGQTAVEVESLFKAAPQSLKGVLTKVPAKTKTVIFIAEIDPDLGFQMKALIEDDKLLKDAYMAYGKTVTIDKDTANRLEKLAQKPVLSIANIREYAGDEIADECKKRWAAEEDTTDFYKDVPEGLKEYHELLQHGYAANLISKDHPKNLYKKSDAKKFYNDALLKLGEQKQMGIDVNKYLNREFDPTADLDATSMPQLLAFISSQNQQKQNDEKRQALFKSMLVEEAKKLRAKAQPV